MSALPFFTAIPTAANTPSALPSNAGTDLNKAPSLQGAPLDESHSGTEESLSFFDQTEENPDAQGMSFWQTLQQQEAAHSNLSLGQGFTAVETSSPNDVNKPLLEVEEIRIEEIHIEGLQSEQALEALDVTMAPWNMMNTAAVSNAASKSANPLMDQIESQRNAQPQYQANKGHPPLIHQQQENHDIDGAMTPSLLQSKLSLMNAVPPMQGEVPNTAVNPDALTPAQLMAPALKQALVNPVEHSGLNIDESILGEELVNLHEKPKTLSTQSPALSTFTPVNTATGQETTMHEVNDAMDGLQALGQASNKDESRGSRVIDSSSQLSEKIMANPGKIDVPPSHPKFTEHMAQRIGIMASEQLQTARIQLDPPELGSLEIKIKVQHDQVSVAFASGNQVVRDALETQAPRLKEMLEQQGVELADVNVSDQQTKQGQEQAGNAADLGTEDWVEDEMLEDTTIETIQSDALVDYFA